VRRVVGNKVGDEGARDYAKALTRNCTLTTLWCAPGDVSLCVCVCVCVTHCNSLQSTGLGDCGVCELAGALAQNSTLRELE
jgi:hypothetical protein